MAKEYRFYMRNCWKYLVLAGTIFPLYSMDNGTMKTKYNNRYNATTLFGDSEAFGIVGKRTREILRSQNSLGVELHNSYKQIDDTLVDLNRALLAPNISKKEKELLGYLIELAKVGKNIVVRKTNAAFGPHSQFYNTSRSEILDGLKADLHTLETINEYARKKDIDLRISELVSHLERERFMHTQLQEYNMPATIGIMCTNGEENNGHAEKPFFSNHEYVTLNYENGFPLFAIKLAGLHEIAHIYYHDNDDSLKEYNRSPLVAATQITAPFISYLTTFAALRCNALKRAALPLGILVLQVVMQ